MWDNQVYWRIRFKWLQFQNVKTSSLTEAFQPIYISHYFQENQVLLDEGLYEWKLGFYIIQKIIEQFAEKQQNEEWIHTPLKTA